MPGGGGVPFHFHPLSSALHVCVFVTSLSSSTLPSLSPFSLSVVVLLPLHCLSPSPSSKLTPYMPLALTSRDGGSGLQPSLPFASEVAHPDGTVWAIILWLESCLGWAGDWRGGHGGIPQPWSSLFTLWERQQWLTTLQSLPVINSLLRQSVFERYFKIHKTL